MLGLNDETIWWNHTEYWFRNEDLNSMYFGCKVGWGIICGYRLRITPRIGVGNLFVGVPGDLSKSYALTGSVGVRADLVLANHFGVAIIPEYCYPLNKSDVFDEICKVSSKVKGWGSGFNCSLGLYVYI